MPNAQCRLPFPTLRLCVSASLRLFPLSSRPLPLSPVHRATLGLVPFHPRLACLKVIPLGVAAVGSGPDLDVMHRHPRRGPVVHGLVTDTQRASDITDTQQACGFFKVQPVRCRGHMVGKASGIWHSASGKRPKHKAQSTKHKAQNTNGPLESAFLCVLWFVLCVLEFPHFVSLSLLSPYTTLFPSLKHPHAINSLSPAVPPAAPAAPWPIA